MGGWGPEIPFLERIEKPVRKNGPPLIYQAYCLNVYILGQTITSRWGSHPRCVRHMAQYLMYIDCHLSNTELYKYLFFVDMDEFIVPALVSTHSSCPMQPVN